MLDHIFCSDCFNFRKAEIFRAFKQKLLTQIRHFDSEVEMHAKLSLKIRLAGLQDTLVLTVVCLDEREHEHFLFILFEFTDSVMTMYYFVRRFHFGKKKLHF